MPHYCNWCRDAHKKNVPMRPIGYAYPGSPMGSVFRTYGIWKCESCHHEAVEKLPKDYKHKEPQSKTRV